jgi:hypothetical protein
LVLFLVSKVARRDKKLSKDMTAIDQGGPSREFIHQLWKQMGRLEVSDATNSISVALFEKEKDVGLVQQKPRSWLVPQKNEMVELAIKKLSQDEQDRIWSKMKAMYRAIGRIMARCMLSLDQRGKDAVADDDYHKLLISAKALPAIYRNVLFRGITPQSPDYGFTSLIPDVSSLLVDRKVKDERSAFEMLGIEEGTISEMRNAFRIKSSEIFLHDRSNAWKALKEGATLDGAVPWNVCFRYIPRQALDALGFAKPSITMDDVFNIDGGFRFIHTECLYDNPAEDNPTFDVNQIALMEGLGVLFREEIEAKSTYIEDLLHYCTGQAFIPDMVVYPNYKVTIEFTDVKEMKDEGALPGAHTCDNTFKCPVSAYGGSIEVFKKKMQQAIEGTRDGFDMG